MTTFDIVVVGAGLIGAATAKFLAKFGKRVCLIGPSEPKKSEYGLTEIFGSHFDEGRISYTIDTNPILAHCCQQSLHRVAAVERESGVSFFRPTDYLHLMDSDSIFVEEIREMHASKASLSFLDMAGVGKRLPPFRLRCEMTGALESSQTAGSINPRLLLKAQKHIFTDANGTLIDNIVTKIERTENHFIVHFGDQNVTASKIVLALGAFWMHNDLLPPNAMATLSSKVAIEPLVVARFPLDGVLLESLRNMPNLCFETERWEGGEPLSLYMMSPIVYPDGKFYLKVGCDSPSRTSFSSAKDVSDWFRKTGRFGLGDSLVKDTRNLIAGLSGEGVVFDFCALTFTESHQPLIAEIDTNTFIFSGCNGYGAMCSDEFGRLLAMLTATGVWDCPFDKESW